MPWSITRREGKWCVIKDSDGSESGCHDSRADAVKQQRALYANESRMASMYAELDAMPEEELAPPEPVAAAPAAAQAPALSSVATELVGLILKDERERSLIASLATSMEEISTSMKGQHAERTALVAALENVSAPVVNLPAPIVNVEPQVTVEPPSVTVTPEITVQAAEITIPAPEVHVHPEVTVQIPEPKPRTVTFERDPLTGSLAKAEVREA